MNKQLDGFGVIFISWLKKGIFFVVDGVYKASVLLIPLSSALPRLWPGRQMDIRALGAAGLEGTVTHPV